MLIALFPSRLLLTCWKGAAFIAKVSSCAFSLGKNTTTFWPADPSISSVTHGSVLTRTWSPAHRLIGPSDGDSLAWTSMPPYTQPGLLPKVITRYPSLCPKQLIPQHSTNTNHQSVPFCVRSEPHQTSSGDAPLSQGKTNPLGDGSRGRLDIQCVVLIGATVAWGSAAQLPGHHNALVPGATGTNSAPIHKCVSEGIISKHLSKRSCVSQGIMTL